MDDLGAIFSLNNWPGHLSYVLIAISYWLTDMFWLRAVAVIGLSLEILYFWLSGGDLRTGIGWDLIFIAINLYQIYRLMKDRLSLRLPEPDRELLRSVLSGLDDLQIARLLVAGEFCDIADGTTLATENQPLERIFFICAGRVKSTSEDSRNVKRGGRIACKQSRCVGDIELGSFEGPHVGCMGLTQQSGQLAEYRVRLGDAGDRRSIVGNLDQALPKEKQFPRGLARGNHRLSNFVRRDG